MLALNNPAFQNILVTGAQGQLGSALRRILKDAPLLNPSRAEFDLSQPNLCLAYLEKHQPSLVFNAAAFTQVDLAEKERELARTINTEAPAQIAAWCAQKSVPFVHYSTDYVFSGQGSASWKETDPIQPLNYYGETKALGEQKITQAGGKFLIFRTSWVYDAQGKNFLRTMLKLGKEKESLRIVNDQFGAPTFATHLAWGSLIALQQALEAAHFPSGIYHLCNSGETSWYQFAQEIFSLARQKGIALQVQKVEPISSSEFPTPAQRPQNSRLNMDKLKNSFQLQLPSWEEGLKECFQEIL